MLTSEQIQDVPLSNCIGNPGKKFKANVLVFIMYMPKMGYFPKKLHQLALKKQ